MPVAIRAVTRLQDADDINVSLGAGVDEYALVYDHDTAKFVLRAPAAPFAGLLATGATVGATSQAQAFTTGVTVGSVTTAATLLQVAETSTASPRGIMSSQHNTGTDGARFHMRKSRGTNASPTVIVTGDVLGRLVASGYDGSSYLEMGGIDIVSAGTIASTRVPTEIRFLTATDAAPSVLTQRMVIDKAGNVGIGAATAYTKLDVAGIVASGGTGGNGEFRSYQDSFAGNNYVSLKTDTSAQKSGLYRNGTPAFFAFYDTSNGDVALSANFSGASIVFQTASVEKARISNAGYFGVGIAPVTPVHAVSTTAATNAIRNVLTLGSNVTSTGVGAAGLGPAILFQAESTTTVDTTQAAIEASWIVATHASRTSRLAFKAYDTAAREGIRIDASGTAALLGFYGHAAAAQPSAYTPSNVSTDRSFDADTVLVAELADVVGTLIADLQSIGLIG